jgi:hypothetical protein
MKNFRVQNYKNYVNSEGYVHKKVMKETELFYVHCEQKKLLPFQGTGVSSYSQ